MDMVWVPTWGFTKKFAIFLPDACNAVVADQLSKARNKAVVDGNDKY